MWAPGTSTGTTTFCNFCWQDKFNFVPALHFVIAQLFFPLWLWLFFCVHHFWPLLLPLPIGNRLNWTQLTDWSLLPTIAADKTKTNKKTLASKWQPTNSLLPSRCRPNTGRTGRMKNDIENRPRRVLSFEAFSSFSSFFACWRRPHKSRPFPFLLFFFLCPHLNRRRHCRHQLQKLRAQKQN